MTGQAGNRFRMCVFDIVLRLLALTLHVTAQPSWFGVDTFDAAPESLVDVEPYWGTCGHPDSSAGELPGYPDRATEEWPGYPERAVEEWPGYPEREAGEWPIGRDGQSPPCRWSCEASRRFPTKFNMTAQALPETAIRYWTNDCWRPSAANDPQCRTLQPPRRQLVHERATYSMRIKPDTGLVNG